jgi:hypothetical protein
VREQGKELSFPEHLSLLAAAGGAHAVRCNMQNNLKPNGKQHSHALALADHDAGGAL